MISTASSVLQHCSVEVCSHEAAMDTLRRTVRLSCSLARQGARSASTLHPHNQVVTAARHCRV